ncbi:MAG: hypothetical protein ACI92Z_001523 [Paracoccaceae bacterium]
MDIFVSLFSTAVYLTRAWVTRNSALKNFYTGRFAMVLNVRLPTWPAYFLPLVGFFWPDW